MRIYIFLFKLFEILLQCLLTKSQQNCPAGDRDKPAKHFAVFGRLETGKALHRHVILTKFVTSDLECSSICLRHSQCASFNYEHQTEPTSRHLCELNNETKLTRSRDLLLRSGFSYYGIEMRPCFKVNCQNGGTCRTLEHSIEDSYCCSCQLRYEGPYCERLKGFRFTNSSSLDHASVQLRGESGAESWTICLWIKATAVQRDVSTPLSYVTNTGSVVLQLLRNGTIRIIFQDNYSDFSFIPLMENTWHHVCITWENVAGNLSLFVDRFLIGQQASLHLGMRYNGTRTLVIGQCQREPSGQFVADEFFFGDILDVNIWSYVLSLNAIKTHSTTCGNQHGDLLSWPMFSNGVLQFHNEAESVSSDQCRDCCDFDLEFPRRSKDNYLLLTKVVPHLSAFTVSFLVAYTNTQDKAFISYFVDLSPNELLVHQRTGKFIIRIKGFTRKHDFVIPPDGLWHHVAVTWENQNGDYQIFVDGNLTKAGSAFQKGKSLSGGGTIALGNDYDASGFQVSDAFVGNISKVNIWDSVFTQEIITSLSEHCGRETGSVVAWKEFRNASFYGMVNIWEPSSCRRL